jgi:hypothetical protein
MLGQAWRRPPKKSEKESLYKTMMSGHDSSQPMMLSLIVYSLRIKTGPVGLGSTNLHPSLFGATGTGSQETMLGRLRSP